MKIEKEEIVPLADRLHVRGEFVAGRSGERVFFKNYVVTAASKQDAEDLMDALDELISELTDHG